MAEWQNHEIEAAKVALQRHRYFAEALAEINATVRPCSQGSLKSAFARRGLIAPSAFLQGATGPRGQAARAVEAAGAGAAYTGAPPPDLEDLGDTCKTDPVPPPAVPPPVVPRIETVQTPSAPFGDDARQARAKTEDDPIRRLVEATKRGAVAFDALCDRLDMSPAKTRALIEQARAQGVPIDVAHDHVGIPPTKPEERIQNVGIAPVVGQRSTIGVISDTHLGSKYCLREQLREFIQYAYHDCGVREILHPGDVIDGTYRHGIWEVSHSGLHDQVTDLIETLPCLPGLNYRAISGNHDETTEDGSGLLFGPYCEGRFRAAGRHDIHFYGRRSAFIRVGGAVIHMWHPRGSCSYAKSYKLQKMIESYSSGEKPHILLVGHFHQYAHVLERGVRGFLCPTFQGGGSAFGKSLGGAPSIGGQIMSWQMTEHGTMRSFVHEYRAYYEVERPHSVSDETALREEVGAHT